jgi:glycosyltransferase involved in cell wall biosynthesis
VGRICVEKGVEYLVKAADIIINRLREDKVQFILVGPTEQFDSQKIITSPYIVKIIRMINKKRLEKTVKLIGAVPVDDLRKLYAACDMVAIPSIIDLDPQVQIEAMSSGKPLIGTAVGTMPRRIQNGISGYIVEPANEERLAEKIKHLLDSPREIKKMGAFARQLVEEQYSSEKMATRLLDVFQNMVSTTSDLSIKS